MAGGGAAATSKGKSGGRMARGWKSRRAGRGREGKRGKEGVNGENAQKGRTKKKVNEWGGGEIGKREDCII